jgi:hypothetical protein
MSDYGFFIKNELGATIFDAENPIYVLYEQGSGTCTYPGSGNVKNYQVVFATPLQYPPLIAIRPTNNYGPIFLQMIERDIDSSLYTGFYIVMSNDPETGTSFDWKAFKIAKEQETDEYGIRLKNKNGLLVYDSSYNAIVVLATTKVSVSGSYQDVSHSGIISPYYILSPTGVKVYDAGDYWVSEFMGIQYLSSTSVRIGWTGICGLYEVSSALDSNPEYDLVLIR